MRFCGVFCPAPSLLTRGMGTCAPLGAHLWESRWWGHLRACLHARDESCSRQSGRSLFVDSFPSGLWIRLIVPVKRWLARRGEGSPLLHKGPGACKASAKNGPRISSAKLREASRSPSFRDPGLWMCLTAAWTRWHLIGKRILYSPIQIIRPEHTCIKTWSSGGQEWAPFKFNH